MRLKTYVAQSLRDWFEDRCLYTMDHNAPEYYPAIGTRAWQLFGRMLHEFVWAFDPVEELHAFYVGNDTEFIWIAANFAGDYYTCDMNDANKMKRHTQLDLPFKERPLVDFIDDFCTELDWYIQNYEFEEAE